MEILKKAYILKVMNTKYYKTIEMLKFQKI